MADIPDSLYRLAPTHLSSYRSLRFDGAGYEVPTTRFARSDRDILCRLYRAVQGLPLLWHAMRDNPDYVALEEYIGRLGDGALMADAHQLGVATHQAEPDFSAALKAAHDIRGGGLSILVGTSELLAMMPGERVLIRKCIEAARDHAKIMRNLLPDIDPEIRISDEAAKAHGIEHFTANGTGWPHKGRAGRLVSASTANSSGRSRPDAWKRRVSTG